MKLLVAYDGSASSDAAVDDMLRAGLPDNGKALVLCCVDTAAPPFRKDTAAAFAERGENRIRSYFPKWEVSPIVLTESSSADAILKTSKWWQPDLLVAGRNGENLFPPAALGNVSLELVHRATCSVRVTRTKAVTKDGPIRLVVGDDGSDGALGAIQTIAGRSWPEGTEVRVLTVGDGMGERSETDVTALRNCGLKFHAVCIVGDPQRDLVREAQLWNCDAIFVGSRGLSTTDRFLVGSVSTAVVTRARCTVEVVR